MSRTTGVPFLPWLHALGRPGPYPSCTSFVLGGGRVLVDFRYNFSHSNLGFNGSQDFAFSGESYYENFEHRNHSITLSVGYLLYYNSQLKRKGSSTAKVKK